MRVGLLFQSSGLARVEGGEAAQDIVLAQAFRFLRAGGTVTLTEWAHATPEERDALVAAGDHLAAERAAQIGLATRDPAAVERGVTIADLTSRAWVVQAAGEAARQLRKGRAA